MVLLVSDGTFCDTVDKYWYTQSVSGTILNSGTLHKHFVAGD